MSDLAPQIPSTRQFDDGHLLAFLKALSAPSSEELAQSGMKPIDRPNSCTELRIFNATYKNNFIVAADRYSSTLAGWYNDWSYLKVDAQRLRGNSGYIIPNPIDPDLMCRSYNRLQKAKKEWATSDSDILALRWLFIDIDVKRKSDISATNDEVGRAIERRDEILAAHSELKRSALWGCSGNGGFILVRIPDYPNDPKHKAMVARFNDSLVAKFSDDKITVDEKTKNPARLMCLPGTMKCKGESKGERIHRMATFDSWVDGNPLILPTLNLAAWLDLHGTAPIVHSKPQNGNGLAFTNSSGANEVNGGEKLPSGTRVNSAVTNAKSPIERARACIAGMNPAISGQGGHKQLYGVAVTLVDGFGLDYLDALSLMRDWNAAKAIPPEDDAQIVHKLEDAFKNHPVPSLKELNANRIILNGSASHESNGDGHIIDHANQLQRMEVALSPDIKSVIDQAEQAIGQNESIFQRTGQLVTVVRDKEIAQGVFSDDSVCRIVGVSSARVRELMSESADWVIYRVAKEGSEPDRQKVMVPEWAAPTLIARQGDGWPTIRSLQAVVDSPVLRPDGSILGTPGYDHDTAILYRPNAEFLDAPSHPSLRDAKTAAASLMDLIAEFPIVSESHRAVWLAALLTPFARYAIDGACPIFFFDANTPAAGKSKLVDVISMIVAGQEMSRTVYPETDDEMRKRITSILLAGMRMVLIDNIPEHMTFGNASLDALLTGKKWSDRILGKSEMSGELPSTAVWYGTGNNVTIKGDILRRTAYCRIDAKEERAEQRSGYRYNPLLGHVAKNRTKYVRDALTILRAFVVADRPKIPRPAMDFVAWSDLVRSCVFWATEIDPWDNHEDLRKADANLSNYMAVIEGWQEVVGQDDGITAAKMLQILKDNPTQYETLRTALMEWSRTDSLPTPRQIGMRLKGMKDRIFQGRYMHSRSEKSLQYWSVQYIEGWQPGTGWTSWTKGTSQARSGEEPGSVDKSIGSVF